ncbi:MAG: TetR/AcrR family transcriptional regulator [Methylophaga sp.]
MQDNKTTPDSILDTALELAANQHWEAVRLTDVALKMNLSLADLHLYINEKEDLIDLLWDRADRYMLLKCQSAVFDNPDFPAQFEHCVMTWLDSLAPYRNTVTQMLQVRLEPGHLHIQLPTLFRISRTVQWMREICGRDATFLKRASEEIALTTIFVTTACFWLRDKSMNASHTRSHLSYTIRNAVKLENFWPGNSST